MQLSLRAILFAQKVGLNQYYLETLLWSLIMITKILKKCSYSICQGVISRFLPDSDSLAENKRSSLFHMLSANFIVLLTFLTIYIFTFQNRKWWYHSTLNVCLNNKLMNNYSNNYYINVKYFFSSLEHF